MYSHRKTLRMGILPALIFALCVSLAVDTTVAQSKKEDVVQSKKQHSKITSTERGQASSFSVSNSDTFLYVGDDGKVGIGTTSPNEQLEITGNFRLPATTATIGIIFSGADRFIHNFGTNNFFAGEKTSFHEKRTA